MVDVYSNSFLTIAATWSKDSQGGCYSTVTPTYFFEAKTKKEGYSP
jgi:hypothetical protein